MTDGKGSTRAAHVPHATRQESEVEKHPSGVTGPHDQWQQAEAAYASCRTGAQSTRGASAHNRSRS